MSASTLAFNRTDTHGQKTLVHQLSSRHGGDAILTPHEFLDNVVGHDFLILVWRGEQ